MTVQEQRVARDRAYLERRYRTVRAEWWAQKRKSLEGGSAAPVGVLFSGRLEGLAVIEVHKGVSDRQAD